MATKLFNTVNYYDAGTAFNAAAAEMLQIDLAIIAASVTVTFPVGTVPGQCIGVLCAGEDGVSGIYGAGPVSSLGFPLLRAGACALFTWDASLALWVLVSQYQVPTSEPVGYSQSFVNADLTGDGSDTLTVTHSLNSVPTFAVYDGAALAQNCAAGGAFDLTVIDPDTVQLVIRPLFLPLADTWVIALSRGTP